MRSKRKWLLYGYSALACIVAGFSFYLFLASILYIASHPGATLGEWKDAQNFLHYRVPEFARFSRFDSLPAWSESVLSFASLMYAMYLAQRKFRKARAPKP